MTCDIAPTAITTLTFALLLAFSVTAQAVMLQALMGG